MDLDPKDYREKTSDVAEQEEPPTSGEDHYGKILLFLIIAFLGAWFRARH